MWLLVSGIVDAVNAYLYSASSFNNWIYPITNSSLLGLHPRMDQIYC